MVALLRHGPRSPSAYAAELSAGATALALLEREHGLLAGELIAAARAEMAHWERSGYALLTVLDRSYPENLRAVHQRPPLLFTAGLLKPTDVRSLAVIGSRRATDAGLATAHGLSRELAERGYTIVSGLARGIDTAAHHGALDAGGRTIAVIGTGLGRFYPPENRPLQARIARQCAVVSPFWPDAPPTRESFPQRNGVMAGIALATVIVEAGVRSGARIQARLALAQGRPVLLWESLLAQGWAQSLAQRPGVHVVASASDVSEVVERLTSTTR